MKLNLNVVLFFAVAAYVLWFAGLQLFRGDLLILATVSDEQCPAAPPSCSPGVQQPTAAEPSSDAMPAVPAAPAPDATTLEQRTRPVALTSALHRPDAANGTNTVEPEPDVSLHEPQTYSIAGVATVGGKPTAGVYVMALVPGGVVSASPDQLPTLAATTDETGKFVLNNIPCALANGSSRNGIRISATKPWSFASPYWRTDERILCPKSQAVPSSFVSTYRYVIALVCVFLFGLFAAVIPVRSWSMDGLVRRGILKNAIQYPARLKYVSALTLTTLLSAAILFVLALFHMSVGDIFERPDSVQVVNLGAAYLHRGSYVDKQSPQLLLSLSEPAISRANTCLTNSDGVANCCSDSDTGVAGTSEPVGEKGEKEGASPGDQATARGLGAPLWVILLGSIGAFAFAIQLVIKETADPPTYLDIPFAAKAPENSSAWQEHPHGKDLRKRCAKFVELQFHSLFAPLAALIVYQMLVTADAAGEFVTVAIMTLASALAVPFILRYAQQGIERFLNEDPGTSS